ncbi:MAG TPA: hypothetical protein VJR89_01550 [Polyangiales bacterium]|nr:hypothetical protein [Polyangiales bacterium]
MQATLVRAADASRAANTSAAVNCFISSAVSFGVTAWLAVKSGDDWAEPAPGIALAVMFLSGTTSLIRGFGAAFDTTQAELRLERWRATRAAGELDVIALARYEGELAAQARSDYANRFWYYVDPIALGVTGGATLALTVAAADTKDERLFGYTFSAVLVGFSALVAATLDTNTFGQNAWRDYVKAVNDPEERKRLLEPPKPAAPRAIDWRRGARR